MESAAPNAIALVSKHECGGADKPSKSAGVFVRAKKKKNADERAHAMRLMGLGE